MGIARRPDLRGMARHARLRVRRMKWMKTLSDGNLALTRSFGCLLILVGLNACQCRNPREEVNVGKDLVLQARQWRQAKGMAAARDELTMALGKLDSGRGFMEKRLWRTNADKAFSFPGSLDRMPVAKRGRTGIFFLPGFDPHTGDSLRVIQQAVDVLQAQGWRALLVPVPLHLTPRQDAAAVQAVLAEQLPLVDQVILVGFSKGGLDWMHWFAEQGRNLPEPERSKIRLMLTFAGALRGSAMASWLTTADGRVAWTTRAFTRIFDPHGKKKLEELKSISADPWAGPLKPRMRELTPGIRLVSLVAIPEGKCGRTEIHRGFCLLSFLVSAHWCWLGPLDGMTETASQVLPPEAGVSQHIVRVQGSHALLDGRYLNGGIVSKIYLARGSDHWRGGEELLDDLLRALPSHWVIPER